MTDERSRSGTAADRRNDRADAIVLRLASLMYAMFIAVVILSIACTYAVVQSRHAADRSLQASRAASTVALDAQEQADTNAAILKRQNLDRAQGRDEICTAAEREHKRMVRGLRTTYRYLLSLNDAQLQEPLNQLVLGQLRRTETTARHDPAPSFCDKPGVKAERLYRQGKPGGKPPVGLPEPDPRVPARPQAIDRLLDTSR